MRNVLLGLLLALGVHAALALALAAYFRYGPRPDVLATLDLSSVDLSFAEREDESAAASPAAPSEPPPEPPPKPRPLEPPPAERERLPIPPDPTSFRLPEPAETRPEMAPPERPAEECRAEPSPPASAPAPAAAPKQAKIDAPPKPKRTIRPDYPRGARQRGEQGEVALEIEVSADGTVADAQVIGSCGFAELDAAAVKAVRAARFVPARSGDRPVASTARLKISFRLK